VPPSDRVGDDDLVDAILEGSPIDWTAAESSSEQSMRPLLKQLKVVAAVAAFARSDHAHTATVWGHLRLLEQIGRGAFGEVYRAWDTRLDREVALKLLPADRSAGDRPASAIIHEGRLLARVRHPNVVTIYGAGQMADQIGLWMEFVRGQTLEQILDQRKVVSAAEAVDIGLELCRAMSAVHGANLLHRDIKTHNVMRAEDGRIVLMDFGTGRELTDDASSDLAGTPLYLAPEVLDGQQATVQSDIYSLGVLLYHLVAGSYPVHAQTVRDVRRAHERGERTAVRTARRDVPQKFARVIERAIDPRPERRFQSADALGAALATLKPRPRPVRLAYAAGVAGASVLLTGVGWEVAGRQLGSSRTPSGLLAGFSAVKPVGGANVGHDGGSITAIRAIAVLPLANLSGDPEQEYVADGMTEELIARLSTIRDLRIISRTSVMRFKDGERTIPEIAKLLNVDGIVEGSVTRDGRWIRITAKLVRADAERSLWSGTYDRELRDILKLQSEVAQEIARQVQVTISPRERSRLELTRAVDPDVYEKYLRGVFLLNKETLASTTEAVRLLETAVERDATFAPAHAALARAYNTMGTIFIGGSAPSHTQPKAIASARKVLELDPDLPDGHAVMAYVLQRQWRWTEAEAGYRRAIELDPNDSQAHYGLANLLACLGRFDDAVAIGRRARDLDPLSSWGRDYGSILYLARRYDEAIRELRTLDLLEPGNSWTLWYLGYALLGSSRFDEAVDVLERSVLRERNAGPLGTLSLAYGRAGRFADAKRILDELTKASQMNYVPPSALVEAYIGLGDFDRAFLWLERAYAERSNSLRILKIDPVLDPVRGDPRLADLLGRVNLG
jgi:TolB-like protein/Tfp pilus assembly protein PilF/tRNA A-37 threonylcarbamoyl transferase component Bud32